MGRPRRSLGAVSHRVAKFSSTKVADCIKNRPMSPNLKKSFHYCIIIYIGVLLSTFEENKKRYFLNFCLLPSVLYFNIFLPCHVCTAYICFLCLYLYFFSCCLRLLYTGMCKYGASFPHGRSCHENYKRYELRHHPNKHINKNG